MALTTSLELALPWLSSGMVCNVSGPVHYSRRMETLCVFLPGLGDRNPIPSCDRFSLLRHFANALPMTVFSGASFMSNILRCIFGHNFTDIPNHIPESIGITSANMLAFFLFWLVHFPLCAFRPYQLRAFFWFKSIVVLPAVFGLFIFCMANTKGRVGSVYTSTLGEGAAYGWFIMYGINSGMGNTATCKFGFTIFLRLTFRHATHFPNSCKAPFKILHTQCATKNC